MGTFAFGHYEVGVALIIALGFWVLLPSIHAGRITDDYMEVAMLDGVFSAPRHPLDLFNFTSGSSDDLTAAQRLGSMPYWAHPDLKLSFMRPLSSALVWLDHTALGADPVAGHLHSLLWWVALVLAVAYLYRSFLPTNLALLAVALFALSDAHHFTVLWLANRGGIVSLCFGVLGLHTLLLRARRTLGSQAAACLLFSLSLLAGEWVFPLFGLAITHALVLGPTGFFSIQLADTGKRLLPMLGPMALFLAVRTWLGYGAHGGGVYVDPITEPLRFIQVLSFRAPILVGDLLLDIPAHWWDTGSPWRGDLLRSGLLSNELWLTMPSWQPIQVALGLLATIAFSTALAISLRTYPVALRKKLIALTSAAALALIPVAASFPSSRLGLPAWVFAAPAAALVMQHCTHIALFPAGKPLRSIVAALLTLMGLGYTLLLGPVRADIAHQAEHFWGIEQWVLNSEVNNNTLPNQHVFIFSGGTFTATFFYPYVLHAHGRPMPKSSYPIVGSAQTVDLYRDSSSSFILRPLSGKLLQRGVERFFRDPDLPYRSGQRFVLPHMTVEITKAWQGKPLELRANFEHSLDDPRYVFLRSRPLGMTRVKMPDVGKWIRLYYAYPPNFHGAQRGHYERRIGPMPPFIRHQPEPEFITHDPESDSSWRDWLFTWLPASYKRTEP